MFAHMEYQTWGPFGKDACVLEGIVKDENWKTLIILGVYPQVYKVL